jgi:hypothetical protein
MHPSVERCGSLFTAATGLDAHAVRDSLDGVPKANFLLNQEPGKTNAMRLMLRLLSVIPGLGFSLHDTVSRCEASPFGLL